MRNTETTKLCGKLGSLKASEIFYLLQKLDSLNWSKCDDGRRIIKSTRMAENGNKR